MPVITTCPICGFHGNHGFYPADRCSGMAFYHTAPGGIHHTWYETNGGEIYTARLEAFLAGAHAQGFPPSDTWHQMMVAKIKGDDKKADRLGRKWLKEEGL